MLALVSVLKTLSLSRPSLLKCYKATLNSNESLSVTNHMELFGTVTTFRQVLNEH